MYVHSKKTVNKEFSILKIKEQKLMLLILNNSPYFIKLEKSPSQEGYWTSNTEIWKPDLNFLKLILRNHDISFSILALESQEQNLQVINSAVLYVRYWDHKKLHWSLFWRAAKFAALNFFWIPLFYSYKILYKLT